MIERSPIFDFVTYAAMILGLFAGPDAVLDHLRGRHRSRCRKSARCRSACWPSSHLLENLQAAWTRADLGPKMLNSFIVAVGVTVGKIIAGGALGLLDRVLQLSAPAWSASG